jgi:TldD protein
MLDKSVAQDIIFEALSLGADFCDVFIDQNSIETISLNSSKIKDIKSGVDFGIGVRLIYGEKALYGYTNSTDKEELIELTRVLAQQYKSKNPNATSAIEFQTKKFKEIGSLGRDDIELSQKIQTMLELDKKVRDASEKINQVNISLLLRSQKVEIFDSEGLHATDERPYCRFATSAIAKDGDNQAVGMWSPGARGGYSFVEEQDLDWIADYTSKQALTVLGAIPCPAGKMPVVIDNGFGGVIFHEACGHSLETTAVQKKASVFWDRKGEQIANEAVSAVDDGTMDGLWGSISIDDEGMETQKTQLIKNGKLENFLCDRMGEIKTGHPRTGSGRRESYKYAPASRMRNTFIEPGKFKVEELISSIDDGIYAKSMGGGSVNPGTGEFNFSIAEGYIVKNGKIKEAIKGATLIGKGEEILKNISMVADNFSLSAGMCGSVSGAVPTAVGQAALKVDEILVGGKA